MRPWQRPPMTAKPSPTACSRTWIGPLSRPTGEPRAGSGSFTRQLKARSLLIPTASVTVAGYRCLPSTPKSDSPTRTCGSCSSKTNTGHRAPVHPRRRPRPAHRRPDPHHDRASGRDHRGPGPPPPSPRHLRHLLRHPSCPATLGSKGIVHAVIHAHRPQRASRRTLQVTAPRDDFAGEPGNSHTARGNIGDDPSPARPSEPSAPSSAGDSGLGCDDDVVLVVVCGRVEPAAAGDQDEPRRPPHREQGRRQRRLGDLLPAGDDILKHGARRVQNAHLVTEGDVEQGGKGPETMCGRVKVPDQNRRPQRVSGR